MDELKSALKLHQSQLTQIEKAISSGQGNEELVQLHEDMKELISLKQDSLLSYEKSKLIAAVDDHQQQEPQQNSEDKCLGVPEVAFDKEMSKFYTEIAEGDDNITNKNNETREENKIRKNTFLEWNDDERNNEFLDTIENCDDICGRKCRAPITTDWSGTSYHNAMIMNVVNNEFVTVLFINPVSEDMKTCPYNLDERCRFSDGQCQYSHGHLVNLYHLHKFKEPDFSNFCKGSSCLVKQSDGLWAHAQVESCHDNHQFSIRFLHKNLNSVVDISDIFPTHHDKNSDDDSDNDDIIELGNTILTTVEKDTKNSEQVGSWEKYTRGIGSKIMMKQGYVRGEGLGRDRKGRLNPVPVVVLPPGKSLDHCMNVKEKKKVEKQKQPQKVYKSPTVFHFINNALGDKHKKIQANKFSRKKDLFGIKPDSSSDKTTFGSQLLKNDYRLKELNNRIKKLRGSVSRNMIKNPKVANQLGEKLAEALEELKAIQSSSKSIEAHQNRSETHKKMTKF